jgi:hypothetical protein
MAQPANTFDSYDTANSIREDLSDIIYDISPTETPFYSSIAKTKATSTNHEWLTDSLRASAANAHIEGDDTSAEARTATTRLGNYTQIFKNAVVIPDTDQGLDKAGKTKQMAYTVMQIAKEQKLDIEAALFANNAKVGGSATVARELAGVPAWITTNTSFGANEGADPTGDGTDGRTDETTTLIAFSQARFDSVMQATWLAGGKIDTVYLSSFQMDKSLGFTGNNNARSNTDASSGKVINDMAIYQTPWGRVTWTPTRENRSRDVFLIEKAKWACAVLRPTKNVPLAKTGDNEKRQITTELTLQARNESANGGVFDNTIT